MRTKLLMMLVLGSTACNGGYSEEGVGEASGSAVSAGAPTGCWEAFDACLRSGTDPDLCDRVAAECSSGEPGTVSGAGLEEDCWVEPDTGEVWCADSPSPDTGVGGAGGVCEIDPTTGEVVRCDPDGVGGCGGYAGCDPGGIGGSGAYAGGDPDGIGGSGAYAGGDPGGIGGSGAYAGGDPGGIGGSGAYAGGDPGGIGGSGAYAGSDP
ncbi:MAG: hypothetical protein JW751_23020, partial [Polyangiaceae bacterium]|nr:hypothetical protein [Polyangiaceae bacterium]